MTRPKLGQHFLLDPRFRQRIVAALAFRPDDLVCEIGAGRGAMTGLLAARAREVVALEIDPDLVQTLRQKYADVSNIEVLEADVLETHLAGICERYRLEQSSLPAGRQAPGDDENGAPTDVARASRPRSRERSAHGQDAQATTGETPALRFSEQCYVFGNLPYYITSPILHHLLGQAACIKGMGFVVQREVAERLTALPGSRSYGYLTVLAQSAATPRLEFGIPPGAFSPSPQVDSALLTFEMKSDRLPADDRKALLEFVKRCFARKRKNLLNNLQPVYARRRVEAELAALGLPFTIRAEQLPYEQFRELHGRLDDG